MKLYLRKYYSLLILNNAYRKIVESGKLNEGSGINDIEKKWKV